MRNWIEIEDYVIDAIVGIGEAEQRVAQPVWVDLRLGVDSEAAAGGDLSKSVDYAGVHDAVGFLVQHARFLLIESLAFAIMRLVLAPPAPGERRVAVDSAVVRVRKPEVLGGAVPGVRIERAGEWCDLGTRMIPEKTWLDTLVQTRQGGAWRAHVEPGSTWSVPANVAVFVLAGSVEVDGRTLGAGGRLARAETAQVLASGARPASLLVVGIATF